MSTLSCENYKILINESPEILKSFLSQLKPSKIFIIVDENTEKLCLPVFKKTS